MKIIGTLRDSKRKGGTTYYAVRKQNANEYYKFGTLKSCSKFYFKNKNKLPLEIVEIYDHYVSHVVNPLYV